MISNREAMPFAVWVYAVLTLNTGLWGAIVLLIAAFAVLYGARRIVKHAQDLDRWCILDLWVEKK